MVRVDISASCGQLTLHAINTASHRVLSIQQADNEPKRPAHPEALWRQRQATRFKSRR